MDFRNIPASLRTASYPPRKADEIHKRIVG